MKKREKTSFDNCKLKYLTFFKKTIDKREKKCYNNKVKNIYIIYGGF